MRQPGSVRSARESSGRIGSIAALPVIDLGSFIADPGSRAARTCVEQLREACHGPGFCYVAGHGVPVELDAAMLRSARELFALPVAEKNALAIANSPHFRGYTVLGDERTRGASDWREQLDLGAEEEPALVGPEDPAWLRLRGPNQWPAGLPEMRATVLAWMQAMDRVGLAVLRALAVGLGQPIDHFDGVVLPRGDPHLKIIRYPSQPPGALSDQGALAARTRGGQSADPNDPIFSVFGENFLKVRLRSHPDVARAHYADLPAATRSCS